MTTIEILANQFDELNDDDQCAFIKMLRNKRQLKRKAGYDKIAADIDKGDCVTGLDNIFKEVDKLRNART